LKTIFNNKGTKMRIAFCGKGGSGKTSIASLFIRYLTATGEQVLAIDGDINQHLSSAIGLDTAKVKDLPRIGQESSVLCDYVRGTNNLINPAHFIESTPAGRGSQFVTLAGGDPVSHHFILREGNLRFMAVGSHDENDMGTTCYHKFTGAEGIFLNHLLDEENEFVIGDKCAGADPFASSGLASRYDAIYLVLEPTLKSLGVFEQASQYAKPFGIRLFIIANKIDTADDLAFIEEKTGQKALCAFGDLKVIRNLEKGKGYQISDLDDAIIQSLKIMVQTAKSLGPRDWSHYMDVGNQFHKRAGDGWASSKYGYDIMEQVDPEFHYDQVVTSNKKVAA
jgi:CO dehydrogenase maturation factor